MGYIFRRLIIFPCIRINGIIHLRGFLQQLGQALDKLHDFSFQRVYNSITLLNFLYQSNIYFFLKIYRIGISNIFIKYHQL